MKRPGFWNRVSKAVRDVVWPDVSGGTSAGSFGPFKGAEATRIVADWFASTMTADEETRWSLERLRARCRDLARNNPYAKHYLRMLAVNVIGPTGVTLQATVRDNSGDLNARLNDRIEAAWKDWSRSATLDGKLSRVRLEHLMMKGLGRDGEFFVRMWLGPDVNRFGFALEPIDPAQVDEKLNVPRGTNQNEIRLGIEVDEKGAPVAYHVLNKPRGSVATLAVKTVRIPAEEVIHIYDPDRANQSRGWPWMHAAMHTLKVLDGYEEAELVAARVGAAKMGFLARKDGSSGTDVLGDEDNMTMEANPGTLEFLPDGYEVHEWSPDHPSTAYPDFVKSQLRRVATAFSVSYNALASDLEGVNYSSMRSGLLIEREVWKELQQLVIESFYERIYPLWMNAAMLTGELRLDSRDFRKFLSASWTPRGWPWVDPKKDAEAGILAIGAGLASRTGLLAEQGTDFETVARELAEETKIAAQLGVEIKAAPPAANAPNSDPAEPEGDEPASGRNGNGYVSRISFTGAKR